MGTGWNMARWMFPERAGEIHYNLNAYYKDSSFIEARGGPKGCRWSQMKIARTTLKQNGKGCNLAASQRCQGALTGLDAVAAGPLFFCNHNSPVHPQTSNIDVEALLRVPVQASANPKPRRTCSGHAFCGGFAFFVVSCFRVCTIHIKPCSGVRLYTGRKFVQFLSLRLHAAVPMR